REPTAACLGSLSTSSWTSGACSRPSPSTCGSRRRGQRGARLCPRLSACAWAADTCAMNVERIVPNLVVSDLCQAVNEHVAVLGLDVVMDHGWIVTLAQPDGRQLSLLT